MAGVVLGMPGPWADDNFEAADMYTTKIGGLPDWPFQMDSWNSDLLKCTACSCKLCLLAQVYAPVSSKTMVINERVIYVFGCLSSDCESHLWRALRVQRISTDEVLHETSDTISQSDNVNDKDGDGEIEDLDLDDLLSAFSELASVTCHTKPKKCNAKTRKKSQPNQCARFVDDRTSVLPCFYIYTQETREQKKTASKNLDPSMSLVELEKKIEKSPDEESYVPEMYEYDSALHADRTYLKFKKHMDAYPEQCIRYSYGGKPLLASIEIEDPGNCKLCNGARHYEMQLMPPLIYFLQEPADNALKASLEKQDWITLLIYTCKSSCSSNSSSLVSFGDKDWFIAEEVVLIQHE